MMTVDEQKREIVFNIRKMETFGLIPNSSALELLPGFRTENNLDYWIKREDNFSAHMWLYKANERIISLIFSINKLHTPSNKWKHHILQNLDWQPKDLLALLKCANCYDEFTVNAFYQRVMAYQTLLSECVIEAHNRKLLLLNFYEFYSKKFKRFEDNTKDNP